MTTGAGKCINDVSEIDAIGHRVVHGGEKFKSSCLITDEVINTLRELSPLAPLHNPAGILGIEAARKVFGNIPMVAVFDTAFHSTMPPKAYMYAIPYEYYEKYGVRRYGFHGTSHKYVAHKAAEYLEEPIERLKLITCHLGNGSSIAAVDQGKVVDTSMGMTPLAGLMMGTRCGDLDPSVVNYLKYTLNITGHELDEILNKKSGLLGISGVSSDKRDVEEAAAAGNKRAQLASDMLNYQIKRPSAATLQLWAAWMPSSLPAASASTMPLPVQRSATTWIGWASASTPRRTSTLLAMCARSPLGAQRCARWSLLPTRS